MTPIASRSDNTVPDADPPESGFSGAPAIEVRTFADLQRFLSTAKAGDMIVYHRGYLALDRGAGSKLGDNVGEELDYIATALMATAEAGRVHLIQRRHGHFDYTYLAVMVHPHGRRPAVHWVREIAR